MIDLVWLVADKNMEATVGGLLTRGKALGIRDIVCEILVHPGHDPGCYHGAVEFLRGYRDRAGHGLVLLDRAWRGAPADTGEALEQGLGERLRRQLGDGWAEAVVIDPELEAWVFSDSPHVDAALGWAGRDPALRASLRARDLWPVGTPKPPDPKAAVERALRAVRKQRSSSIYRQLATSVSVERCTDRAFLRLKGLLQEWFPGAAPER